MNDGHSQDPWFEVQVNIRFVLSCVTYLFTSPASFLWRIFQKRHSFIMHMIIVDWRIIVVFVYVLRIRMFTVAQLVALLNTKHVHRI